MELTAIAPVDTRGWETGKSFLIQISPNKWIVAVRQRGMIFRQQGTAYEFNLNDYMDIFKDLMIYPLPETNFEASPKPTGLEYKG
jgi:hypothetical protein